MTAPDVLRRAVDDVCFFARTLLGHPLWPHQEALAASLARYRVMAAGRQVGKSRLLAVIALHEAFRGPNRLVLIVSAGESAARRLLDECAALASSSPLLKGSVVDETASVITLANGSQIRAVPASSAQIRGWPVDVLLVDEAGFIDPRIWQSAEPSIIARPGSRVILSSSPWGGPQHFFRQLWTRGMNAPDEHVASFHWPSSISPLVDDDLLEQIRQRESPTYFDREFMAIWSEGSGAYLTMQEVGDAVADYEMIDPADANGQLVVGGVDYGFSQDANTLVLLGVADDDLNWERHPTEPVFFVAHLEEHFRMPYAHFIDRVVDVADVRNGGFEVRCLASETNGVGQMPTDTLVRRAWERRTRMHVAPVVTDNRRKASMFGTVKGLLQMGRLVLPRHPSLLKQLAALEFEITDSGNMRISVPERSGHDDLCMGLGHAVSCIRPSVGWRIERDWGNGPRADPIVTDGGTFIHKRPRCEWMPSAFTAPKGAEQGEGW